MQNLPSQSRRCLQLGATLALLGFSFLSESLAYLVVNGGFESGAVNIGPGGTSVGGGDTDWFQGDLSGWTVSGSQVENVLATNQSLYYANITNGDPGATSGGPHSGVLAAVFPNTPTYDGSISQVIATTIAGVYKVSFWLGNQVGDNALNSMTVTWGATTLLAPAAIPVAAGWTYYEFDAATATPTTLLTFTGGGTSAGLLLDDVSVVPEVSSFGVLTGFGLLALGSMVRLRRRSMATA